MRFESKRAADTYGLTRHQELSLLNKAPRHRECCLRAAVSISFLIDGLALLRFGTNCFGPARRQLIHLEH